MTIYRLSIFVRSARISDQEVPAYAIPLEVDSLGVIVYCNHPEDATALFVRQAGIEVSQSHFLVRGNGLEDALGNFYHDYPATSIGGPHPWMRAMWIAPGSPILELPPCKWLDNQPEGDYCWKRFIRRQLSPCFMSGVNLPPPGCPIAAFITKVQTTRPLPVVSTQSGFFLVRSSAFDKVKG